ncbi:histidine kinase N-terminal 7TM domain-containing protein [Halorubrum lipolyticum]|uniref:histidine kinase n=1 Tax=Halorubrum lipolyticum DSM 21995 TaxID=1227482 RepID=M0NX30_9EURY|nr:histidine kinase N-terminal 7TM domain-containing protein [Halorubrum lipolyticum]EMA61829.1 HTR-like protein [Halorubrum lipolyticum DSM 21995]
MDWQTTPYVLLLFLTSLTALAWGLYGVRSVRDGDRNPTVLAFVALCVTGSIWAGGYAVQLAAPTLGSKLAAYKLLHVGAAFVGPAWLAFALSYAGRADLLTRSTVAAMVAVPAALLAALPTNPYSLALTDASLVTRGSVTLLVAESGPLYQLHLAYSYLIIGGGVAIILRESLRSAPEVRQQAGLMVAGGVVPLALNVAHVLAIGPLGELQAVNLTPVSLGLSTLLFGVAVFRYRLLDLTPIAARIVLTQIGDGVVVVDRAGSIVDVNPAAEALVGERDRVVGTDLATHVSDYDRLPLDESPLTTVATDDGEAFLQLDRSPIDRGGTRYGWVVLLRDVTELETQRRELERRNERLDAFASVVSHDLRNPLSVIDGYADLARETGDPAHLDVIQDTAGRMNDFLEDLLRLSQQGDTVTEPRELSLAALVAEVREAAGDEGAEVAVAADVTVTADRERLRQALDNLFRNARDHADGPVTVTVGPLPEGFYVEDDGPGIPEADRDAVFDVGFTTRSDGTGLGLAIVRDIVEAHGWSIAATEGPTGGARFEVTGADVRAVAE